MTRFTSTIILFGMVFLAGCSTTNAANLPTISVTEFNEKLDGLVCQKNLIETPGFDEKTCKEYYTTNKNSQFNRMLRAKMLLEVAARFGVARMEEYSGGEAIADASRLLVSLKDARGNLKELHDNQSDSARYYINRTDLTISMLRVVNDATAPLKEEFKKSVLLTPVQLLGKTGEVLQNLFKDALYAHAYATALFISVQQADVPTKQEEIWKQAESALTQQCNRIAKLAHITDADIPAYCNQ